MFDVFPPALEISRDEAGDEKHPEEILPQFEPGDHAEDDCPDHRHQREFLPDPLPDFPAADRRSLAEECAEEKERHEKKTASEFHEGDENPEPAWRGGENEWPQLLIFLRGEVRVVRLVRRPIEAEAHKAQNADEHAVELVEPPVPAQKSVGRLVKSHSRAMHEMTDHQHHGYCPPHGHALHQDQEHRDLSERRHDDHDLKGFSTHPVGRVGGIRRKSLHHEAVRRFEGGDPEVCRALASIS